MTPNKVPQTSTCVCLTHTHTEDKIKMQNRLNDKRCCVNTFNGFVYFIYLALCNANTKLI